MMKRKLQVWGGIAAAFTLCIIFALVFITYARPMEDRMYDLSIIAQDNKAVLSPSIEELQWTVFTQTGDEVTELIPDGYGCYTGLAYPGQTFYFSRLMTEKLDAATLQLGTADRNFSVFLDGEMIYTDCPEADNRIGSLTLPMHVWDRPKDVIISLPEDYVGRTLTIAQSTQLHADTPRMATTAIPCSVRLYCGFAYESELIAESFRTAVIGAVGYILGLSVLVIFSIGLLRGKPDAGLLCLALSIFLAMSARMYDTSYSLEYFGIPDFISTADLLQQIMIVTLLAFFSSRAGRWKLAAWILTSLCAISLTAFILFGRLFNFNTGVIYVLVRILPGILRSLGLAAVLAISWAERPRSRFHRRFAPWTGVILAVFLLIQLLLPTRMDFLRTLRSSVQTGTMSLINGYLSWMLMAVALVIVMVQAVQDELELFTEKRLVIERGEMTRQSYMNLRHDMNRHFQYLRSIVADDRAIQYLDTLIGQSEQVRPIVQSGNEILDIIINSRMSTAIAHGIDVQLTRAEAPSSLPMADADLCSLLMNLLDNAVAAARVSGAEKPVIRLDLHTKNDFFVFVCENSTSVSTASDERDEALPRHGLGLKIISQIVEKYGNLLHTEQQAGLYRVHLGIQLPQAD